MKDVVIASACRTAIGAFGGSLKDLHAAYNCQRHDERGRRTGRHRSGDHR